MSNTYPESLVTQYPYVPPMRCPSRSLGPRGGVVCYKTLNGKPVWDTKDTQNRGHWFEPEWVQGLTSD